MQYLQLKGVAACPRKMTARSAFLQHMDEEVPWDMLVRLVAGHPGSESELDGGARVDDALNTEQGLRVFFLQHWFGLSDENMIESIQDSVSMRLFLRLHNGDMGPASAEALRQFRLWLERRDMGKRLLDAIARHLRARGIVVTSGAITEPYVEFLLRPHCRAVEPTPAVIFQVDNFQGA